MHILFNLLLVGIVASVVGIKAFWRPPPLDVNRSDYEVVQARLKPAADASLPEELHIVLGAHSLKLLKTADEPFNVAVYRTAPDGKILSRSAASWPMFKQSGLYRGVERLAAMTVTSYNGEYFVDGLFLSADGQWHLVEPDDPRDRIHSDDQGTSRPHRLYRMRRPDSGYSPVDVLDFIRPKSHSSRRRRAIPDDPEPAANPEAYYVEVLFVIDRSLQSQFDADDQLIYYLVNLVTGVNLIYQNLAEAYSIQLVLKGIYRADANVVEGYSGWKSTGGRCAVNAKQALDSLQTFGQTHFSGQQGLPSFDHVTLLTACDMQIDSDYSIAGLALVAAICERQPFSSASVVEAHGALSGVKIFAHELGHVLGANHDGTNNHCSTDDGFLMASSSSQVNDDNYRNHYFFSNCSKHDFRVAISSNNWLCLSDEAHHFIGANSWSGILERPPGQVYNLTQQCQQIYGSESHYCGRDLSTVCRSLQCISGPYCMTLHDVYAMPGTSCAAFKWCQQGLCVPDQRAPPIDEDCPFGDNPDFVLRVRYPNGRVREITCAGDHAYCALSEGFRSACCKNCATEQKTSTPSGEPTTTQLNNGAPANSAGENFWEWLHRRIALAMDSNRQP